MSKLTVEWYYNPLKGQPRYLDLDFLLKMAQRKDIGDAINSIIAATLSVPWNATPANVKDFLQRSKLDKNLPKFLRDIVIYGAGVITKTFSQTSYRKKLFRSGWYLKPQGKRKLLEINVADGSSFLKDVDANGVLYRYWQYSHLHPAIAPVEFDLAEIAYATLNPVSNKVYGHTFIESLEPDFKSERVNAVFGLLPNGEPSPQIIRQLRNLVEQTMNRDVMPEFGKDARFIW